MTSHKCVCSKCEISSNQNRFVGNGANTQYILVNSKKRKISKYIVDECLLRKFSDSEKCDFLFNIEDENQAILVECKGSDILKAISQIESTIKHLNKNIGQFVLKARIISTRVYAPDIRSTSHKRLSDKLNGELIIRNRSFLENI